MNIHSHLFFHEIIGFGAGYLFKDIKGRNAIYVHDAYPIKPAEGSDFDRFKSVEMDPESSEYVRHLAESKGQRIFGWYHSHPIFIGNPSKIDIHNQNMYQKYFTADNKPFIGFIVGPYSPMLNASKVISEFRGFGVEEEEKDGDPVPYELNYHIIPQK